MVRLLIYICVAAIVPWIVYAEQDRDPFKPYLFDTPSAIVEDTPVDAKDAHSTVRPLNQEPLSAYRLIGLVISPNKSIAVIQSSERREYLVNIGDVLGKEGGVIESMSVDGLAIGIGEEIINMKVTNKFEIQNEGR